MLQWMGGSRRKVTTSRKSTQKRQKQYFEQRKRQQQNLQMTESESCSGVLGISGQYLKEHQSLDILNLLNLSTNARDCGLACLKDVEASVSTRPGKILTNQPTTFTDMAITVDSCRVEETRSPLCCQIETSPKVLVSAPDHQNGASNGINCKPSNWKTVNNQHFGLSVIDLLYDDGPNGIMEECPTFEDHVAFSLEGLGKVGTKTPVHSPQQLTRITYGYSPLLKDGMKTKLSKNLNHVLEDLELEVDTMMQDIKVAPISSFSNFPYNKGNQSLATAGDCKHFGDNPNKNGSSISQEFFYNTANCNEDIWNVPSSSFLDEKYNNEREYNTSWKKAFQMGTSSPDLLKSRVCKMANYAFEDHLPKKRSSATGMEGFNITESPASYSRYQSDNDYDFFVASGASRCSRSDGNFNVQNLVPEDLRDNSSLLSEESCSSTAVRGKAITHSPSRILTGENRRKHKYTFASPGKKCRSKEGKCRSMSKSSKRKPSHYSKYTLEEQLGAHNGWLLQERYASADINSSDTSFCQNLEAKFVVSGSKNRNEDPFSVFTTPELHNKDSPSFSGLKNGAPVADSPPYIFTSEKSAFADSPIFSDVRSWPTSPNFSAKFQFIGKPQDVDSFHCETTSLDMSVQESVSKDENMKVKLQQDSCFELREENFMGTSGLSSEKKMIGDTSNSNNRTQDCEGTDDTNIVITQSLETTHSLGHVEEVSSLKIPDKHESKVDKTKNNFDAEFPLKCKIANEEKEHWQPEERNKVSRKQNKEQINLSGQVMFESYVLQLLCVQKVLTDASMGNMKKA